MLFGNAGQQDSCLIVHWYSSLPSTNGIWAILWCKVPSVFHTFADQRVLPSIR